MFEIPQSSILGKTGLGGSETTSNTNLIVLVRSRKSYSCNGRANQSTEWFLFFRDQVLCGLLHTKRDSRGPSIVLAQAAQCERRQVLAADGCFNVEATAARHGHQRCF